MVQGRGSGNGRMAASLDEDPLECSWVGRALSGYEHVIDEKMPSFTVFDAAFMVTSMITFLVDIGTGTRLELSFRISCGLCHASLKYFKC